MLASRQVRLTVRVGSDVKPAQRQDRLFPVIPAICRETLLSGYHVAKICPEQAHQRCVK